MRKIAAVILVLLAGLFVFAYYFKPEDLVSQPETYSIRTVEYKGEEITDQAVLAEMAEVIENYQNMPRPKDTPSDIDAFVDLKIIGSLAESKPTLIFGDDIAACYWSQSVGIYEIVDGEMLYQELIDILER